MFTKIHHVAVGVKDIDQALGFYRDALGLDHVVDQEVEEQGVRGALLLCGGAEIELIAPTRPDTGVARFVEKGEGLHHLCFETDDIDAELPRAAEKGLRMIDKAARWGLAGRIGFIHPGASTGVLVEMAQPAKGNPVLESMTFKAKKAEAPAGITNLDHLAVVVKDIEAATKQWQSNFGLPLQSTGESAALGIKQAFLTAGGSFIELISPLSNSGPVAEALNSKGEGMYLLSLATANMKDTLEKLRAKGVRVSDPPAGGSVTFISPRATNGVLIQLIERAG